MYSKLQYISQGTTAQEQVDNVRHVLDAGVTWIQLRFKQAEPTVFIKTAEQVQAICAAYRATFIINDHVTIAKQLSCDGVHLGLTDMPVIEARAILGNEKIIGGTANTLQDVQRRVEESCDYIGLGPFRFTTTKEKLSPVVGIGGYTNIISQLNNEQRHIPIYAIGGILPSDVEALGQAGVYGVAVSGVLTKAVAVKEEVQLFNELLYGNVSIGG